MTPSERKLLFEAVIDRIVAEAKKKNKKKKREVKCPLLPNGKRDYKCEYQKYGGASKKGKKDRAARNKARKQAEREGLVKKGDGMEIDHIMPLSLGGSNDPKNWQVLTRSENRKKGKKWNGESGMKNETFRRLIRKLILESNAKGVSDLVPGVHTIEITKSARSFHLYMKADGDEIFRMSVVSSGTGNRNIMMVGAAYVEDPRADGFGPMMYDIALEYGTKVFRKWVTSDRGTCSEDAQKVWKYYMDHRQDEPGMEVMKLDNNLNLVTPEDDDNVETPQADELYYFSGAYRYANRNPTEADNVQKVWYQRSPLMYAYKKAPSVIPQLQDLPGVLQMTGWK